MCKDLVPFWEKAYQEYDTIAFSDEPNVTVLRLHFSILLPCGRLQHADCLCSLQCFLWQGCMKERQPVF